MLYIRRDDFYLDEKNIKNLIVEMSEEHWYWDSSESKCQSLYCFIGSLEITWLFRALCTFK